jgi:hypothetical protein
MRQKEKWSIWRAFGAFGAPMDEEGGRQWLKGATTGNTETNACRDRFKKEVKDANP